MSGKQASRDKKLEIRTRRIFSEEFKRQKVHLLIAKKVSIKELSEVYQVSKMSIYRWLYRYSPHHSKGTTQVVQMQSEESKHLASLKQIAELERIIGQKQMQIDFLEKMIELASEELKVDIQKNFDTRPLNGSDKVADKKASK
jgi:transposase